MTGTVSNNDIADALVKKERQYMLDHIEKAKANKNVVVERCQPLWDGEAVSSITENLYDFEYLKLIELWRKFGIRGQNANVYVIDSGLDASHPGFQHHKNISLLSFLGGETSGGDGHGHGTWVCGKIAAQGTGIAPKCKLTSIRTLDDSGTGSVEYSTSALKWVLEQGDADIVNMSLGSPVASPRQEQLINKLSDKGVIVVAAAGNFNSSDPFFPAGFERCLTVSATDRKEARAEFSNYGGHIDIAAPGVSCYGPYLNKTFRKMSGTSMAAPIVAGVLALGVSYLKTVKQMNNPTQNADILLKFLFETANDLGVKGKDKFYGFGGINAFALFERLSKL